MSSSRKRCHGHGDRAPVARCGQCDLAMCDECFRFRADGKPACARCAYAIDKNRGGRWSLAITFLGMAGGALAWATPRFGLLDESPGWTIASMAAIPLVSFAIGWSGRSERAGNRVELSVRDLEEEVEAEALDAQAAHPYRGRGRRVLAAMTPRVSGKATALVLMGSLVVAAAAFPAAFRLPRWVEVEGVLAVWWVVFAAVLTTLLYRGFKLRDDFVYFLPWNQPKGTVSPNSPDSSSRKGGGCGADGCSIGDVGNVGCDGAGEGFVVVLGIAVIAALLLGAAWVLTELAFPTVFILGYLGTMRAIGRVARDHHGCQGALTRSLGWGAAWATIYVAPLALVTWLVHLAATR